MIEKGYFAHSSAIIDEGCTIGNGTLSGIFRILCLDVSLVKAAILVRM